MIGLDRVELARTRIAGRVLRTPVVASPGLSRLSRSRVDLKIESVQPTGSFKVRGAASKILSLSEDERRRGVVTASTGNHGMAVAHIASELGVRASVCVSQRVPPGKVRQLELTGCDVVVGGDSQDEAMLTALALVNDKGMSLVHPFDDPEVIAGQGTVGLEIMGKVPDTTHVVVPLSGGGLASGVAAAVKGTSQNASVLGVSMVSGAVMAASLQAGEPVDMAEQPSLADSLQGGIGIENEHTFAMVRDLVDEVVLVSEERIWQAMLWTYNNHGLVLEGGGAVGIAAVMSDMIDPGARIVIVCSGGNVEPGQLKALSESRREPPG